MTFASDAQRRWYFANNGGGAGGGSGVPSFPVGGVGGHWHTINVCGVEKQIWVDASDVATPEEARAISEKEDRKAYDMQQMMGG